MSQDSLSSMPEAEETPRFAESEIIRQQTDCNVYPVFLRQKTYNRYFTPVPVLSFEKKIQDTPRCLPANLDEQTEFQTTDTSCDWITSRRHGCFYQIDNHDPVSPLG